jgi:hypothetical protein
MTDGDVGNVDAVVSLIKQHNHNSRVFTIGIGQDVNRRLVEKVANASCAVSEILLDNPNISTVVAKMLDASTKSYYKQTTIVINGDETNKIMIDKPLYPNKFLTVFHKAAMKELVISEKVSD